MASRHVHNRTSLEQDIQAPQRSNFVRSICDRRACSSTAAVLVTDGFKEFRLIRLIQDYLYDGSMTTQTKEPAFQELLGLQEG
jgi:hypothetical protein